MSINFAESREEFSSKVEVMSRSRLRRMSGFVDLRRLALIERAVTEQCLQLSAESDSDSAQKRYRIYSESCMYCYRMAKLREEDKITSSRRCRKDAD